MPYSRSMLCLSPRTVRLPLPSPLATMPQRRGTHLMRTPLTLALCIAVLPLAGRAQEMPGIDLSQPGQAPPPPGEPAKPGEGGELPPIDLTKPQQPPPAEAKPGEKEGQAAPVLPFSEKDVALGDKVKAVQRKGFIKAHRLELAPMLSSTINDPYYLKFGG